jgi:hypothetical protein
MAGAPSDSRFTQLVASLRPRAATMLRMKPGIHPRVRMSIE